MSTKAMKKKKSEIDIVQKEIVYARQALASAKGRSDSTTLAVTVEFITASLGKIAEKRRLNINKTQKMLRRRITTMLRPSVRMLLGAINAQLPTISSHSKDCFDIVHNDDELSPELRAEQLLLLALHPPSTKDPLPSVPDQANPNRNWAEPGWQIRLDNPSYDRETSISIMPVRTEGHLSQAMAATCSSCGRQAAALIKPRHLRMLTDPLSFECQASDPSNSGSETIASHAAVIADPLSATDNKYRLGYNFVYRPEISDVVEKATKDATNNNKSQRAPKVTTTAIPKRKRSPTKKQKIEALAANDLAKAPDHHSQQISPSHPLHQSIIAESTIIPSQQTYRSQFQPQHQQQSQRHLMTLPQRSPSQQNLQFQQQQQQNMAAMRQLQQQYQVNSQLMQSNPMQFMLQPSVYPVPGSISIVTSPPDLQPQNKKSA